MANDAASAGAASPRRASLRRTIAAIAAFLAVITLSASTVGIWAHRTLLDTDTYVKTVSKLARDPDVINAMAEKLTDETMALVDFDRRVRDALPEQYRLLSVPLGDAARSQVKQWLIRLMETEKFQQIWASANRVAHKTVVGILRNDLRYVDSSGGEVKVDLVLVAADAIRELGERVAFVGERIRVPEIASDATPAEVRAQLGASLGITIPDGFGQITVLRSDELADAQRAVALFDRVVIELAIFTVVFFGAAIAISTRRFRMLIALGLGAILAFALASSLIRDAQGSVEAAIVEPAVRAAVGAGVAVFGGSLEAYLRFVVFGGIVLVAIGFLGGESAPARVIRQRAGEVWGRRADGAERLKALSESRALRWTGEHALALQIGGVAVGVMVVLFAGLRFSGLVLLLAVLGAYELVLALLVDDGPSADDRETANSEESTDKSAGAVSASEARDS